MVCYEERSECGFYEERSILLVLCHSIILIQWCKYKYGLGVAPHGFPCNQANSWQQLNYHCHIQPTSGHEKLEKLEMILKICNFKKENRD